MALASITSTYTDSEDEDNAENSSPAKAISPEFESTPPDKPMLKRGLVSYNDDTFHGETTGDIADEDQSDDEEPSTSSKPDEIKMYPEPTGQCSKDLQERVNNYHRKMLETGLDINAVIQKNKEFRNPSIYEKLVQFVGIEELGTNYPRHIYDPYKWGKESFYEALAATQKEEMEKLTKERKEKAKVQVVSGTVKRAGGEEEGKRKSKWDQKGSSAMLPPIRNPTGFIQKPSLATTSAQLTTSASGTKSSVIPAFGALPKKPKV